MNNCEKVMLDKMVELRKTQNAMKVDSKEYDLCDFAIKNLLDCIVEFHYPTSEPLESGCGKLVVKDE